MSRKGPQPERFQHYVQTPDGTGFKIKNSSYIYRFDENGGWKDQDGNYYNASGEPDEEPQGALQPQKYDAHQDSEEDEYEREYGPKKGKYEEDDYDSHQSSDLLKMVKNMERISENNIALETYPQKTPLRVHYRGIPSELTKYEIYAQFSDRLKGIINVITNDQEQQQGHFVVQSASCGRKLLKHEGSSILGQYVHFTVEPYQDLLMIALTGKELKQIILNPEQKEQAKEKIASLKEIRSPKRKSSAARKSSHQRTSPKQEFKLEQEKFQDLPKPPKVDRPQSKEEFKSFTFDLTVFAKREDFKSWMEKCGLKEGEDYKDLKGMTRKSDGLKYGQICLLPSALKQCNNREYNGKSVRFGELLE